MTIRAEAEKSCWEAQYYRNAVGEAMKEKYGYTQASTGSPANGGGNMARSGYDTPQMSERAGYSMSRMGHDDLIEKLGEEFRMLSPNEQMVMKSKVLEKIR